MATYQDIEGAVKTALLADATLVALATGGIYHLKAPQNAQPPYIVYRITEDTPGQRPFAADTLMQCALLVLCVVPAGTTDADDCRTMSDRARTTLNRQDITTGDLQKCQLGARGYGLLDFDQDHITCTLTYDVMAQ